MKTALCTSCMIEKPLSYTQFAYRKDRTWPYQRTCRDCQRAQRRARDDKAKIEAGYIDEAKPIGAACDACGSNYRLQRDMHDGRIKGTLCGSCTALVRGTDRNPTVIKERLEGAIFYLDLVDSK